MIELHILFASSDYWEYWNTYSNDNHIDEALNEAEEERGLILDWYIERLTDE